MATMGPDVVQAWTQLYAAVGLLAGICSGCALLKTIFDLRAGVIAPPRRSVMGYALWLPKVWLRFQLAYFCGFPSIVFIALVYAHHIGFAAFDPS